MYVHLRILHKLSGPWLGFSARGWGFAVRGRALVPWLGFCVRGWGFAVRGWGLVSVVGVLRSLVGVPLSPLDITPKIGLHALCNIYMYIDMCFSLNV